MVTQWIPGGAGENRVGRIEACWARPRARIAENTEIPIGRSARTLASGFLVRQSGARFTRRGEVADAQPAVARVVERSVPVNDVVGELGRLGDGACCLESAVRNRAEQGRAG